jgi:hypothetical protein
MKHAIAIGVALFVLACSHASGATTQVNNALAAVDSAEKAGAAKIPEAATHLESAKDDVARAQGLLKEGKAEDAQSAANSAYQDAEQALEIARQKGGSKAAQAASDMTP